MGHAKAIFGLGPGRQETSLHELILRDDLSVREAEKAAARIGEKARKQHSPICPATFIWSKLPTK